MEASTAKAKRNRHHDRVVLDQNSLKRIDAWIEQVTLTGKGVMLSRKEMVNWIIGSHEELLPPQSLTTLKTLFFSELRFLHEAIKEVRAAKLKGEKVNMDLVMSNKTVLKSKRIKSSGGSKTINLITDSKPSTPAEVEENKL